VNLSETQRGCGLSFQPEFVGVGGFDKSSFFLVPINTGVELKSALREFLRQNWLA
jgi:hypothetical protein